jgi:fatty-acyl-CoA synthase
MGAVLHTLNVRLFPEQLKYVIAHAEDKVILCDAGLAGALAKVVGECPSVERIVVIGDGDTSALDGMTSAPLLAYADLLASGEPGYRWPVIDERQAAAMCYTSGTTGNPKGVVYSHRSTYLHSLQSTSASTLAISAADRALVVVPQFHANAWGIPYAAWLAGADLILPKQFLQAEPLVRIIEEERPTFAGAVPTIWNEVLRYAEAHGSDLSSFRSIVCGGSAVPGSLMKAFDERYGVPIIQAWGMTETSPLGAVARPPRGVSPEEAWGYRQKAGQVAFGVEVRVVDGEGNVAPRDGQSVGEFEVRGPWVTASYYGDEGMERFHDGWLRTGDVGTVDDLGYLTITDRTKDVIKTGGEWISSVELENALMAHPDVFEAAVVAVPDDRWDERPLACVVLNEGAGVSVEELGGFLEGRVARWWVPERWSVISEVPKTSVGKFDKKVLRAQYAKGDLDVVATERRPAGG